MLDHTPVRRAEVGGILNANTFGPNLLIATALVLKFAAKSSLWFPVAAVGIAWSTYEVWIKPGRRSLQIGAESV
jgi:hypothetical protein